jgi:hypothetical protein
MPRNLPARLGNLSILLGEPILSPGLLIDGILIGAIFALAAYGLALVWGVMNVKNLAQGDFYHDWRLFDVAAWEPWLSPAADLGHVGRANGLQLAG